MKEQLMELRSEAEWLITQSELSGKFSLSVARDIFLDKYPGQHRIFDETLAEHVEEEQDYDDMAP